MLNKSIDSYVLSLETINHISVRYRVESFLMLLCNAWELLLKARIASQSGSTAIWERERDATTGEKRSKGLDRCLGEIYAETDPIRRNLLFMAELRHKSVHLFLPALPSDLMSLAQACVVNYHNELRAWFNISLSERMPVGMMAIVFDVSPDMFDLDQPHLRRQLGKTELLYLKHLQDRIAAEPVEIRSSSAFAMSIRHDVAFKKHVETADGVVIYTDDSALGLTIDRARDPGHTHRFSFNTVIARVRELVGHDVKFHSYTLTCIINKHNVTRKPEWFHRNSFPNAPKQYSEMFVLWIVENIQRQPSFLEAAVTRAPGRKPRRPTASSPEGTSIG